MKSLIVLSLISFLFFGCSYHPSKYLLIKNGFKVENHASPERLHEFDIYVKEFKSGKFDYEQRLIYYPYLNRYILSVKCDEIPTIMKFYCHSKKEFLESIEVIY